MDLLPETIAASHRALGDRIKESDGVVHADAAFGEFRQKTDAFLIQACRHVSSVCAVILPVARRRLPDGKSRVREYVQQMKRLERAVAQAKGRLYGQSRAMRVTWSRVWAELEAEFRVLMSIERLLVADLANVVGRGTASRFASRLISVEAVSPTRPHPHSPHTGPFARLTRQVWMRADAFWDGAEGRIVARPAKA